MFHAASSETIQYKLDELEEKLLHCVSDKIAYQEVDQINNFFNLLLQDYSRESIKFRPQGRRNFVDVLERRILIPVSSRIINLAPRPGDIVYSQLEENNNDQASLIGAAQLFTVVRHMLRRLGVHERAEPHRQRIATTVLNWVKFYGDGINKEMATEDYPDIRSIVQEMIKIEVLRWVLEELECQNAVDSLSSLWQVFGRLALKKATSVIDSFLKSNHPGTRFDMVSILAEIEEIIVLVNQILDGEKEIAVKKPDDYLDRALGIVAINDFISSSEKLMDLMFLEIEQVFSDGRKDNIGFSGRLKQMEKLFAFCSRLADDILSDTLVPMIARFKGHIIELAKFLVKKLKSALKQEKGVSEKVTDWVDHLEILVEFAHQSGLDDEMVKIRRMLADCLPRH